MTASAFRVPRFGIAPVAIALYLYGSSWVERVRELVGAWNRQVLDSESDAMATH
jgi:hypothetical protein